MANWVSVIDGFCQSLNEKFSFFSLSFQSRSCTGECDAAVASAKTKSSFGEVEKPCTVIIEKQPTLAIQTNLNIRAVAAPSLLKSINN